MNRTREDFCRRLLDDRSIRRDTLAPELLAARFVRYFGLSIRPTLDELSVMLRRAGFGEVRGGHLVDLKGIHFGEPGGECEIYYRYDLWEGAREHTVLHETYEIVVETMCDMYFGSRPRRKPCRGADRFAAAALMQPETFEYMAVGSGLDVLTLQRQYVCAYAAVAIRLTEVLRRPPLMTILYERKERGDPAHWTGQSELRATVARRTQGFGTPSSPSICGHGGGVPRRGRPLPPGSLAGRAARYGVTQFAMEGGYAAVARPVFWKGKLAKVAVVAVPERDMDTLGPQLAA